MEELQVVFKAPKRQTVTALIGRGEASRFEMGTGITLPPTCKLVHPNRVEGGSYGERQYAQKKLRDWETECHSAWKVFKQLNPEGGTQDFKAAFKSGAVKAETHTLLSWCNTFISQLDAGLLSHKRTGEPLKPATKLSMKCKVNVIREFVKDGLDGEDFNFSLYNTDTAHVVGAAKLATMYKGLGSKFLNYVRITRDLGDEAAATHMGRLKAIIRDYAKENHINIGADLLAEGAWLYLAPKGNNDEDVFALEPDQFEWLLDNEATLRKDAANTSEARTVDYIMAGLFSCARRGDMAKWGKVAIRPIEGKSGEFCLRFVPEKTEGGKAKVVAQTGPISPTLMKMFNANLKAHNTLLPPLPSDIVDSLRTILSRYEMFKRSVVVNDKNNKPVEMMTYEAMKVHSLRSSGITYLLNIGFSEAEVKQISGHSANSTSFNKYVKIIHTLKNDKTKGVFWRGDDKDLSIVTSNKAAADAQNPTGLHDSALLKRIADLELQIKIAELEKKLAGTKEETPQPVAAR